MVFREPRNFSENTNVSNVQQGTLIRLRNASNPYASPALCIHSPSTDFTRFKLGNSQGCKTTLDVSCGIHNCNNRIDPYTYHSSGGPIPFQVMVNFTAILKTPTPLRHFDSSTNISTPINVSTMEFPSDLGYGCPTSMMWTCGQHSYLYLPQGWSGTCYLSVLRPALFKFSVDGTPHTQNNRVKRNRVSPGGKAARGIVPFYGPIANAHSIDELSVELENLTALVDRGFAAMTAEMKALRTMTLQNRMALDMLLAGQGGVCEVVGEHCCTYVPDVSSNMTSVHEELQKLRDRLHDLNQNGEKGWDFWGWLTSGGWKEWVKRGVTLLAGLLLIFLLLTCCILPCIRMMVQRLINQSAAVFTAAQLPLLPYSNLDPDSEEEDYKDSDTEDKENYNDLI